jgi:hypothetical protein
VDVQEHIVWSQFFALGSEMDIIVFLQRAEQGAVGQFTSI